ncbi:MAG: triose-phosphate isomerase [Firmicutes bacterium HGW-Firmicutes-15]|nr:MAG: triose-phosphate isomerase [Firmicutes bacterium HGW-Firmicutes-15]
MYKTVGEALDFVKEFLPLVAGVNEVDIAVCPPFTSLAALSIGFKGSTLKLGAQDVFWESQGAYTGEISPTMLLDLDCRYVIIGHSERRHVMGESDLIINRKIKAVGLAGMIPIFCVGETLEEREQGLAREVVRQQLEKGLQDISAQELVIAYEPVWAIGTGVNASPADAREMTGFIRENLAILYDKTWAEDVLILYGGSVKPDNIAQFMAEKDVDGALVGGASLSGVDFAQIVRLNGNV